MGELASQQAGVEQRPRSQTTWKSRSASARFLYENGLSLVLILLFLICLLAQALSGMRAYNREQLDHREPAVSLFGYLGTSHFWEALSENWESEFLQMAAFVWLTAFLYQKGSPEAKDPYALEEEPPVTKDSPWPARKGGWVLKIYERSLTLTLFALFLASFVIHVVAGAKLHNQEQLEHGQKAIPIIQYLGTSRLWFESFQNWQSEFLSIGAMVCLSIFLRQKGSRESKPVPTPHSRNE